MIVGNMDLRPIQMVLGAGAENHRKQAEEKMENWYQREKKKQKKRKSSRYLGPPSPRLDS